MGVYAELIVLIGSIWTMNSASNAKFKEDTTNKVVTLKMQSSMVVWRGRIWYQDMAVPSVMGRLEHCSSGQDIKSSVMANWLNTGHGKLLPVTASWF